jgi:hypothetical protein
VYHVWHICCSDVSLHWRVESSLFCSTLPEASTKKLQQNLENCKYFERNLSLPKVRSLCGFFGFMRQLRFVPAAFFSIRLVLVIQPNFRQFGNISTSWNPPSTCCRHLVPVNEWRASAVIDGYARTGKHAPSVLYSLHP